VDKHIPDGMVTTLVKIGIDGSGRTVILASKNLKVDNVLLGRILEAWGAFYAVIRKMPDQPLHDDDESLGLLICPKCGQQTLNPQSGACRCGLVLDAPPGMPSSPDKWEAKTIHCRECGRDVRIETKPDNYILKCGCGRDIYVGPDRRK